MTELSQTVLDHWQIRKSKRQRADFRDYLAEVSRKLGYMSHEEKGSLGARNFVVGNPETARVVYTAHYDTCARLPFPNFITPMNIGLYLLYQLLLVVGIFAVCGISMLVLGVLLGALTAVTPLSLRVAANLALYGTYLVLLLQGWLLIAGPANRHTANDNTSGVITLLEIMAALPEHLRGNVAFIFFDLEEAGMFGSAGYRGCHYDAMQEKLLMNFDCVSDGKTILFAVRKKAAHHVAALEAAFPSDETFDVRVLTKGTVYPSDQMQFPLGVGVAALKKTKSGLLYMDRIHTSKDTVFEEENIAFLTAGAVRLAQELTADTIEL